jgi:hypothetical protein
VVGFPAPEAERMVLENPDAVRGFFCDRLAGGVDFLLAPTARATPAGLLSLGLAQHCWEINRAAIEILQEVAATAVEPPAVAAQMGPFRLAAGDCSALPFDKLYAQYHEQAKALALAGPDVVVLGGFDDMRLLRAALVALRELWSGPAVVVASPAAREETVATARPFGAETAIAGVRAGVALAGDTSRGAGEPADVIESVLVPAGAADATGDAPATRRGAVVGLFPAAVLARDVDLAGRLARLHPGGGAARSIGVSLSGVAGRIDSPRLEASLGALEARTGCALALQAPAPATLEVCARAARRPPVLVFELDEPQDLDCVLYLTRRYGARSVLGTPAAASSRGAGRSGARRRSLEDLAGELCDAIEARPDAAPVPWERLFFDATDVLVGGAGAAAAAIERVRRERGCRWAATIDAPGDQPPAELPALLDLVDLVILRIGP